MSHDHGHFKISRKAFLPVEKGGDVLWNKPREFSEWEAWEYLIARAAFSPHKRALRKGGFVELQRGETPPLAVRFLAETWGWSRSKVHRFLALLETDLERIVGQQHTTDGDTYLIVKYERYQTERDTGGTQLGTARGQPRDKLESSSDDTNPREVSPEEAKAEMWAEFDRRSEGLDPQQRGAAEAVCRGIIEGDTRTAWLDTNGNPVRWADRPALFRLALDERRANGGKLHSVLRQVVIPREYDPFPQRKSTDPKPDSEAARVLSTPRAETPGRSRSPGRHQEEAAVANYVPDAARTARAEEERLQREREEKARDEATVKAWEAANELAARRVRQEATLAVEGNPFALPHLKAGLVEVEYRKRVLAILKDREAA